MRHVLSPENEEVYNSVSGWGTVGTPRTVFARKAIQWSHRTIPRLLVLFLMCWLPSVRANPQQTCQAPSSIPTAPGPDIFTPEQEVELGDAVAEHLQQNFRVISDDELNTYPQVVAKRLLKQMPATQMQFRVSLFDLPVANAFSLPGGRIYISRKMVAFVRNEDELAALLAHEIGHIVAHQGGSDMTRLLHDILGVTQVGDRRDVLEKYNRLIENAARKPKAFEQLGKHEEQSQYLADRIALYELGSTGYAPQSFVDFWDRFAQTHGKTGGWFSDFFGLTKPEERRLREMRKSLADLPLECSQSSPAKPKGNFSAWQAEVVAYSGLGRKEALHGLLVKKALTPPLRSDIRHLRFSPDGRYLLAQDDSSIYVLSRDPIRVRFRIDAPEAHRAQFAPDSNSVVFHTPGLRVEQWDTAQEQRSFVREMVLQHGCLQSALSPDGKTLACFDPQFNLSLVTTDSDTVLFEKKSFYQPKTWYELFQWLLAMFIHDEEREWIYMDFSPDAHIFVAAKNDAALAFDLATHRTVSLPGSLKELMSGGFAFLAPDRVVGVNAETPKKSGVAQFPSGERMKDFPLGAQRVIAPGKGDYVILRPLKDYPLGVLDLRTMKILALREAAVDIYDMTYARELPNGEVGLFNYETRQAIGTTTLPRSPLGRLRAAELSPELGWFAISERNRGAVWNLWNGQRLYHVRGFRGAYFDGEKALYSDFPKFEKVDRGIVRLDLYHPAIEPVQSIEESFASQAGRYLLVRKPNRKDQAPYHDATLEVQDVSTSKLLWSRNFRKEVPTLYTAPAEGTMVLVWSAEASAAQEESKADPRLPSRLSQLKDRKSSYFLEVVRADTGGIQGRLVIDTGKGSFRIERAFAAGGWVVITDSQNRSLVYEILSGAEKGSLFGAHSTLSTSLQLLCVENEPGELSFYDLNSLERKDHLVFPRRVSFARFTPDGKRLFVLTSDQVFYLLDATALGRPGLAASSPP